MTPDELAPAWEPVTWAREVGVTYRQLDYWARQGWVHPVRERSGSGTPRRWPEHEKRVVRIMGRLTAAGVIAEVAAGVARQAAAAGPDDPLSIVTLTPDVTIMVANE